MSGWLTTTLRLDQISQASQIPPRAIVSETSEVAQSCVVDGSTSGAATGSSQSENGCQTPAIWSQPPTTESTDSTPTAAPIENGASPWLVSCRCSRAYAERSPPNARKSIRNV